MELIIINYQVNKMGEMNKTDLKDIEKIEKEISAEVSKMIPTKDFIEPSICMKSC